MVSIFKTLFRKAIPIWRANKFDHFLRLSCWCPMLSVVYANPHYFVPLCPMRWMRRERERERERRTCTAEEPCLKRARGKTKPWTMRHKRHTNNQTVKRGQESSLSLPFPLVIFFVFLFLFSHTHTRSPSMTPFLPLCSLIHHL